MSTQAEVVSYSQLRSLTDRPPLDSLLPLSFPISMYLETTNVCNFRCKFCPESFEDYEQQVGGYAGMDEALFTKIIHDVRDMGRLKVLRFYMMGEPLLNKQLGAWIRHATDQEAADRTELTTNATGLTEKRAIELIDSGLTYLRVSIYAINPERHQHVTGSRFSVERIFENVARFQQLRQQRGVRLPKLYVKMIDAFDEGENQAFLNRYGPVADEVVLEKPMNWTDYEQRDLIQMAYDRPIEQRAELFPYRKQICPFPFYTVVVNANGDVTVCCVDWNKKTKVGNLREQSLREVWNGPELRAFRRMHIENRRHENASCRHCTYLHTSPDNLDGLSPERYRVLLGQDDGTPGPEGGAA